MTDAPSTFVPLPRKDLTAALLHDLLDYDPASGFFVWKPRPRELFTSDTTFERFNAGYAGGVAGRIQRAGVYLTVMGTVHRAEELVWLYVHGRWPLRPLRFVDGDLTNTALSNLRELPDDVADLL